MRKRERWCVTELTDLLVRHTLSPVATTLTTDVGLAC